MKHTLAGYTGFVGGNLCATHSFDALYNSRNIEESFGAQNGLVVYSAMPSEKYLANADPAADRAQAQQAFENICRMRPERLVLISTVDVYPNPQGVNESTPLPVDESQPAYGQNRLLLEKWVREEMPRALIVRLPALYGNGLKKNFLYDALTLVPTMLKTEKYEELEAASSSVADGYEAAKPGFYKVRQLNRQEKQELYDFFKQNDFNSLCFTDSRAVYQFYGLNRLWRDIETCLKAELTTVNMAVEPLRAGEIFNKVFGKPFENHLSALPVQYDMRTCFADVLGGSGGYVETADEVLASISDFVSGWRG